MQIFSGKDEICSLLAVNRCKNVIRVSLLLGWDERSQKDKPEERRNCGCRRERLFNRFKRRSDPRLSYEAQSQKNGKSRKKRFSRTAPAPVATRATLVHGLGRCASSSPGGSSFPRYRRRDRSAQTDRARREARRIRPITLRPRGTTQSPMAQLTDSMSNLAEEFPTRIMECGLLPLTCAGVEVSNKLHVTCTVVKGAPPASPARACNDPRDRCHTIPRGRAPLSFSAFLTRPRPTRPRRTQSKPRIA